MFFWKSYNCEVKYATVQFIISMQKTLSVNYLGKTLNEVKKLTSVEQMFIYFGSKVVYKSFWSLTTDSARRLF